MQVVTKKSKMKKAIITIAFAICFATTSAHAGGIEKTSLIIGKNACKVQLYNKVDSLQKIGFKKLDAVATDSGKIKLTFIRYK